MIALIGGMFFAGLAWAPVIGLLSASFLPQFNRMNGERSSVPLLTIYIHDVALFIGYILAIVCALFYVAFVEFRTIGKQVRKNDIEAEWSIAVRRIIRLLRAAGLLDDEIKQYFVDMEAEVERMQDSVALPNYPFTKVIGDITALLIH